MRWFKTELSVYIFNVYVNISTPDFNITNPECYPSWYPKVKLMDLNTWSCATEYRYVFNLDWLFHLIITWGKQTPLAVHKELSVDEEFENLRNDPDWQKYLKEL